MSDADWAAHVRVVRTGLEWGLKEGWATHLRHTVGPAHDVWSEHRAARQDSITAALHADLADVPGEGHAVLVGGLNCAGRSTVLERHDELRRSAFATIDLDTFTTALACSGMVPRIPGLSPMEAAALAHHEACYLARRLALRAMTERRNLSWAVSMCSAERTARRVAELRAAGYQRVDAIFVDMSIETSVSRAQVRHRGGHELYLAGQGPGGRFLPAEVIRFQADPEYGSVNRRAFETIRHLVDAWSIYDNSADGVTAVLVDQGSGASRVAAAAGARPRWLR
jgi:predicted ABC-type ATPase